MAPFYSNSVGASPTPASCTVATRDIPSGVLTGYAIRVVVEDKTPVAYRDTPCVACGYPSHRSV